MIERIQFSSFLNQLHGFVLSNISVLIFQTEKTGGVIKMKMRCNTGKRYYHNLIQCFINGFLSICRKQLI